jgi:hypothetical protein
MSAGMDVDELSRDDVLSRVEVLHATIRRAEAEVLMLAVRFAVLNGTANPLGQSSTWLPGRELLRQLGGPGTPLVAEFAPSILAARLGLSPYAGTSVMADALDLYHRHPQLWARVRAGEVKASYAREVARRTRELPRDQAIQVDEQVAEEADGRVSWSRFTELIDATIIAIDPATAARREAEAAARQFAAPTRTTEDGMRGFYLRAPFPVIDRLEATVSYLAQALADFGDQAVLDDRRVKAVLILANPTKAVQLLRAYAAWRNRQDDLPGDGHDDPVSDRMHALDAVDSSTDAAGSHVDTAVSIDDVGLAESARIDEADLLPTVRLFVHLTQAALANDCTGVARIEGQPPITAQWVKRHLGGCRITVTPVLDLANQIPVDAWEIPQRHRHAVHLMAPADVFPFATNTTRGGKQIDHTIPFLDTGPPGQSRIGNYGPMTVFHHRLKTHGGWQVAQPFPGVYLWRDPTNTATYVVDHTGTRNLGLSPTG